MIRSVSELTPPVLSNGLFVSRMLLLLVLMAWLAADSAPPAPLDFSPLSRQLLMFGVFGLIVLIPALWSRVLARYVAIGNLPRSLNRFNWGTQIARILIPLWFAVCVFGLGWVQTVNKGLGPIADWHVALPAALVGTLPPLLTWAALWWASYPADRALREQSLLLQLQDGLPVHSPPGFWSYFGANLRLQILFTVIPVALILFVRDVLTVAMTLTIGNEFPADSAAATVAKFAEYLLFPLAGLAVFIIAPEILRRILHTQRLPDSPLRQRLEAICRRMNLRYRDILLWRTGNNMGNAAVMGVIPRVRYILLSDVLLETMTDRQIEAVFAHEAGHVVHRHLLWYGIFVIVAMTVQLILAKFAEMLNIDFLFIPTWLRDPLLLAGAVALFFGMFGLLSRCFERQADVFAARTMEQILAAEEGLATAASSFAGSFVGPNGARVFTSALSRVATINNIPIRANNFSHGSIAKRMLYLRRISLDPRQTARFDRYMSLVFACLMFAFVFSLAWFGMMMGAV